MVHKSLAIIALLSAVTLFPALSKALTGVNPSEFDNDGSNPFIDGLGPEVRSPTAEDMVYEAVGRQNTLWVANATEYKGDLCIETLVDVKSQFVTGLVLHATAEGCIAAPLSNGSCADCTENYEIAFHLTINKNLPDASGEDQFSVISLSFD